MKRASACFAAAAVVSLSGCGTTTLDVPYRAAASAAAPTAARPLVAVGDFTDTRGEPAT